MESVNKDFEEYTSPNCKVYQLKTGKVICGYDSNPDEGDDMDNGGDI